nr:uncharacterized protein LOC117609729 [Osmia lignaria]
MATKNEEFTKSSFASFCTSNIYIPQQLIEANELLKSVSRRLEDCALEWQAKISHKQWKIFNSKAIEGNLSEHSLLARTYFSEKHLDEIFQYLLTYNKIFSEYLKTFIDLLQGELSNLTSDNMYNIQTQCNAQQCKMLSGVNIETSASIYIEK